MKPLACIAVAAALATGLPTAAHATVDPYPVVRVVHDLDYVHSKFFFIADHPVQIAPGTLHVWLDDHVFTTNAYEVQGIVRIDPTMTDTIPQVSGYFSPLTEDQDYFVHMLATPLGLVPVIETRLALARTEVLAVSYIDAGTDPWTRVGTVSSDDFSQPDSSLAKPAHYLLLKALHMDEGLLWLDLQGRYDPSAPWYRVVPYEVRSIYDLGMRDIPKDGFRLRIREIHPWEPENPDGTEYQAFIGILGLDQTTDPGGGAHPDGLVDDEHMDYERGLVVFPDLHPFAPDTTSGPCPLGYGGFLCMDNLERNSLRPWNAVGRSNPRVYDTPYAYPTADARYYLEMSLYTPPPLGGSLRQNVPNPFNPETRIDFELNWDGHARLAVYDIQGRLVTELLDRDLAWGPNTVHWDGKSGNIPVASGVYYYVLETGGHRYTRRMVLAR